MTTPDDEIVITIGGQRVMTRPQLAAALGLDPAAADTTVRHALRRAGIEPDAHLDGRTPLYLADPTLRALRTRPGRWSKADER